MSLEMKENPNKIIATAVILEAFVLVAGVALFLTTGSIVWVAVSVMFGAAILLPALLRAKAIKDRENAR